MTATPISVVVPTRDRPAMLERCLRSLRASLRGFDELVVVDSASSDVQVRRVAEDGGARYVRLDRPGVCRARNAGWRAARHELVAFVDDDVRVAPGWAEATSATTEDHRGAAFFTGRVAVPPEAGPVARPVAVKDDDDPQTLDASTRGNLGHSANLVVRVEALRRVDGFDESLGAGGRFRSAPEVDLFDRLIAEGYVGRYSPEIVAWHEQWRSKTDLVGLDWRYGMGGGARLAKLVRTDRRRARQAAADFFWAWGIRRAATGLARRDKLGVAAPVVRMMGAIVGFVRAIGVPLDRGHFRPRQGVLSRLARLPSRRRRRRCAGR